MSAAGSDEAVDMGRGKKKNAPALYVELRDLSCVG